jgi:hypothetical protein
MTRRNKQSGGAFSGDAISGGASSGGAASPRGTGPLGVSGGSRLSQSCCPSPTRLQKWLLAAAIVAEVVWLVLLVVLALL